MFTKGEPKLSTWKATSLVRCRFYVVSLSLSWSSKATSIPGSRCGVPVRSTDNGMRGLRCCMNILLHTSPPFLSNINILRLDVDGNFCGFYLLRRSSMAGYYCCCVLQPVIPFYCYYILLLSVHCVQCMVHVCSAKSTYIVHSKTMWGRRR